MLKGRLLFDKYIIKRDHSENKTKWSLQQLVFRPDKSSSYYYSETFGKNDDTEDYMEKDKHGEISMLLSMFHVTYPTQNYKYWLLAALNFLFSRSENNNICSIQKDDYVQYLQSLALSFFYNRFLKAVPDGYEKLIVMDAQPPFDKKDIDNNIEKLNKGTAVANYIFNYLDYLLWKKTMSGDVSFLSDEANKEEFKKKVNDFVFTFRNSVEHYYPQNPIGGPPLSSEDGLDSFGNLCLISRSKNSKLSNHMPSAKKDYYRTSASIDSIKQLVMMSYEWWDTGGDNDINEIEDHRNKMIEILRDEHTKQ